MIKKIITITFAMLLILTGMHLTFSAHYCGGKLHSSSISFNGKIHGCSMETPATSGKETTWSTHCCENKSSVYSVGNDYSPSDFQLKHSFLNQVTLVLQRNQIIEKDSQIQQYPVKEPPGFYSVSDISRAEICVFRI